MVFGLTYNSLTKMVDHQGHLILYDTSSNCSGQAYLPDSLPIKGIVDSSNILRFPTPPFQVREILSNYDTSTDTPPFECQVVPGYPLLVGAVTTFDLNSLNLIPPFRITEGFQPPN